VIQLSLETTTRATSVCLTRKADILADSGLQSDGQATVRLVTQIQALLDQAELQTDQIERILVSIGPGSFTGLRLGIATAKTLAYAIDCPVVPVPTHWMIADQALGSVDPPRQVATAIDAQRGQWFTMIHDTATAEAWPADSGPAEISDPQPFIDSLQIPTLLSGNGLGRHLANLVIPPHVAIAEEPIWRPLASSAAALVTRFPNLFPSISPFQLKPDYGRKSAAEENLETKTG